MKKLITALAAALVFAAMTACSLGDSDSGDFLPFTVSQTETKTTKKEKAPDISEKVEGVELPFAAEYYLSGCRKEFTTACKAIVKGAADGEKKIDLTGLGISSDELADIVTLTISCVPDIATIDSEYGYSSDSEGNVTECRLKYIYGESERKQKRSELDEAADMIIGSYADSDLYTMLIGFHDAIIRKCTYTDKAESPYSAYGCLVEGEAVCEGYSKAFLLLCQKAGIDCISVFGSTTESDKATTSHIWNKVRIDGEWYNVDVTWDDPVTELGDNYLRHDYFMVPDELIRRDHTFEENGIMKYPAANAVEYNYFRMSGLLIEDPAEAESMILHEVCARAEKNDTFVQVRCADSEIYKAVTDSLFAQDASEIFSILSKAAAQTGAPINVYTYSVSRNENAGTITLIIEYY